MFKLKNLFPYFLKIFLLFSQLLFISSCGTLDPVANIPIRKFELNSSSDINIQNTCNNNNQIALQIMPVRVNSPYDSTKMFYSKSQYELANYSYNQWITLPQNMFTQLIEHKIMSSCLYSNVLGSGFLAPANYRLSTQLIELKQTINSKPSTISLIMNVQLINNVQNKVIKSKIFVEKTDNKDSPEGFVGGANEVTHQFLENLVQWLKEDK